MNEWNVAGVSDKSDSMMKDENILFQSYEIR